MTDSKFDTFGGSLIADVLHFNRDAMPEPDTLYIRMRRGEKRIADEMRRQFGGFKRVVIDVDGERHEFDADTLVKMLEESEQSAVAKYDGNWFVCANCGCRVADGTRTTNDEHGGVLVEPIGLHNFCRCCGTMVMKPRKVVDDD